MKKTSIFLFSILLVSSLSFSQEKELQNKNILYLFQKYEEKADLSNQTKKESLGHIIIFTRKDLDIMQANYLSDVLKLTPLSNFAPNQFGVESLTNSGESYKISTKYRLYINDHEVSSIATYSPFLTYDRYPLDNIDHIEIYFAPGAIAVSNEPSQMIIKLYTKDPKRENISSFKALIDNKSGHLFGLNSAKPIDDDSSYLFTVSHAKINFEKLLVNNKNISRDQERTHLFFQYSKNDWFLDTSISYVDRKGFFGLSLDGSPDNDHMYSAVGYVALTKFFLEDKSLKINLAYDLQKRDIREKNKQSEGGIYFPTFWTSSMITGIHEIKTMHKLAFTINKEWKKKDNEFLLGAFVRYYRQFVDKFNVEYQDGLITKDEKNNPNYNLVKYFWIASFYSENKHNIYDNLLYILGLRLDSLEYDGGSLKKELTGRIGVIYYPKKNLLLKGFMSHVYIIPSLFNIETNRDKNLESTELKAYTLELECKLNNNSSITGFIAYNQIDNYPVFNEETLSLENSGNKYDLYITAIRYIQKINTFNKVEINIWKEFLGGYNSNYFSPNLGGYLRLLTEYKDWQVYNELVYKGRYTIYGKEIDPTYNYTVAIAKEFKRVWKLKFRGENLFNSSAKVVYKPVLGSPVEYQAFDRRFLLTLEKVF